jgi:hypothetical protein
MSQKKAKALRRKCKEWFGKTKADTYFQQVREKESAEGKPPVKVRRIVAEDSRRSYKKEKREYKALSQEARARRYE